MSALSQVDPGTNPFLPMFPAIRLYDNHLKQQYNIAITYSIINDILIANIAVKIPRSIFLHLPISFCQGTWEYDVDEIDFCLK